MKKNLQKIIIFSIITAVVISSVLLIFDLDSSSSDRIKSSDSSNEIQEETSTTSDESKNVISQNELEKMLENSKNAKLVPKNPLDKEIAPGTVFGFTVDNNLGGGMNAISMSDKGEKFSVRFTSKFSEKLENIHLYLNVQEETHAKIGIQEDDQGLPSGKWMGESPGYVDVTLIPDKNKQVTVGALDNVSLKEGVVYHVVLELEEDIEADLFIFTYHANWPFTPFNHKNPDKVWPDVAINTLVFEGDKWAIQDKWPIFVIDYVDGLSDGQPYSLMAPWVIRGSSEVGQTIRPFSNYEIDQIAFVVSYDGNPTDNLYYAIHDQNNNKIQQGLFATSEEVSTKKSWHQIKLESPVYLESGNLYRIILSSPGTDLDNAYKVHGHEFMLDRSLGYGSVHHHLTKSLDGSSWNKWYDADTAFKLITK